MRYAVFTSFYIDADSAEEAIAKAKYIAAKQDTKNDDCCTVDEIREAEFGKFVRKVIYSKNPQVQTAGQ